jgi:hypothetical protein
MTAAKLCVTINIMQPSSQKSSFHPAVIIAIISTLLLFLATAFGIWAFMERQDYKNNVDKKIEVAVTNAKKEEASRKDNEFIEENRKITQKYTGPSDYGTISFDYQKAWSGYEKIDDGTPLLAIFHPNLVPGGDEDEIAYALKVEVLDETYDEAVSAFTSDVEAGKVKANPFKPKLVPDIDAPGTRFDGEVRSGVQGSVVMLSLRDKTIKISTESPTFLPDFDQTILETLTFVP